MRRPIEPLAVTPPPQRRLAFAVRPTCWCSLPRWQRSVSWSSHIRPASSSVRSSHSSPAFPAGSTRSGTSSTTSSLSGRSCCSLPSSSAGGAVLLEALGSLVVALLIALVSTRLAVGSWPDLGNAIAGGRTPRPTHGVIGFSRYRASIEPLSTSSTSGGHKPDTPETTRATPRDASGVAGSFRFAAETMSRVIARVRA